MNSAWAGSDDRRLGADTSWHISMVLLEVRLINIGSPREPSKLPGTPNLKTAGGVLRVREAVEFGQRISMSESAPAGAMVLEHEAIASLKRGQKNALEPLVRLYEVRALGTALAITGDRAAAEDAVAEAFLKVYQHIDRFDEEASFAPWFYRIVVNEALRQWRRDRVLRLAHKLKARALVTLAYDSARPAELEEEIKRHELHLVLADALKSLSPKQRAVIVLNYYLDLDEGAIADMLGVPVGTVKSRLHDARTRLRDEFRKRGLSWIDLIEW